MKDFKKMHKDSEWVALVNYQMSATEKELVDKLEKTDEDLNALRDLQAKFETSPSQEEIDFLNEIYDSLLMFHDLSEVDFNLHGAHVTIENNQIRGVLNLVTTQGGQFKQLLF
jgi:hypothetical protein